MNKGDMLTAVRPHWISGNVNIKAGIAYAYVSAGKKPGDVRVLLNSFRDGLWADVPADVFGVSDCLREEEEVTV